ncbi:hypothetical protein ABZ446_35970 [Streptomyces sp. NPDC005813]|uniref:hypothetical protein n=1 Tax=Streptomyces sp. NPDC005813 TaxID=3155592 RepID=UPI0033D1081F
MDLGDGGTGEASWAYRAAVDGAAGEIGLPPPFAEVNGGGSDWAEFPRNMQEFNRPSGSQTRVPRIPMATIL